MPDITMCNGGDCVVKEECYRFKATPSQYQQSYFSSTPVDSLSQECDYFWPVDEHSTFKRSIVLARWKPEMK